MQVERDAKEPRTTARRLLIEDLDALAAMASPCQPILEVVPHQFSCPESGHEYGEMIVVWEALCRFGTILGLPLFENLQASSNPIALALDVSSGVVCV